MFINTHGCAIPTRSQDVLLTAAPRLDLKRKREEQGKDGGIEIDRWHENKRGSLNLSSTYDIKTSTRDYDIPLNDHEP